MTIDYMLSMAERRLAQLELAKRNSEQTGDLNAVLDINDQVLQAQSTIAKLKTLME